MTKKEYCNNKLGLLCKRVVITYIVHNIEDGYVYLSCNSYGITDTHTYHKLKMRKDTQQKEYILFKRNKLYLSEFVDVQ